MLYPDYVLVYEVRKEEGDGGSPMDVAQRDNFLRELDMLGIETEKVYSREIHTNTCIDLNCQWEYINLFV